MYFKSFICTGLLFVILLSGCRNSHTLFELVEPSNSGIDFRNQITESDTFNMYEFMNIYTGGGVGIGDIDNDGLEDVIFTGNQVSTKLYLNKGNLQFEDITDSSGLSTDRWCTGVSIVDINLDGFLDIYINVSGVGDTQNLLFINQGDLTFVEDAASYGLNDRSQSMQSSFFDYDQDGDLDMYMIVNPVDYTLGNVNTVGPRKLNGESPSTDKLFRNNGDNTFTDVSREAGILIEGYSLGLTTMDINNDGWSDIYVSNDFLTNDILYINNQDGTFTDRSHELLDHTSFAGMGHDVADINDDGHLDIFVADMLPEDNYRKKLLIPAASYDKYQLTQKMDYLPQYTRNTLQLNNGNGTFSEIGQLAGIDQTDWSWASLFADYDLDGDKDLLITNGFLRDVGDLDYINYQKSNSSQFGSKASNQEKRLNTLLELGEAKIPNYIYENIDGWHFQNKIKEWGLDLPTCSNGAAFADLDNDGDLDLLVNNVNDLAHCYENKSKGHYLKIKLTGSQYNKYAIGAKLKVYQNNAVQHHQHQVTRGYASSVSQYIHFGFKESQSIDSLIIEWPQGLYSAISNIPVDTTLEINITESKLYTIPESNNKLNATFNIDTILRSTIPGSEIIQSDFRAQPLLPRTHENIGSEIVIADINRDGLDDIYFAGQIYNQQTTGGYHQKDAIKSNGRVFTGATLVDFDSDGDLDIYQGFGGTTLENSQDEIWLNDNGQSVVTHGDYDGDGDIDLFIGGRINPGKYPSTPRSYLLLNESTTSKVKFAIDTLNQSILTKSLGMISDAIWSDTDQDGDLDLIAIGEWTGIQILTNQAGQFSKTTVPNSNGWWNSIDALDIDNDGDTDYILGNMGDNHPYNIDDAHPLRLYDADFDNNETNDPIMVQWNMDDYYIVPPRDKIISQITAMRKRFPSYSDYARAPFKKSFTNEEISKATIYQADILSSIVLINKGTGKFNIEKLPTAAQRGPINDILVKDMNSDGWMDVLLVGNSNDFEVSQGNQDALDAYYLINDQNGSFISPPLYNGFNNNCHAVSVKSISNKKGNLNFIIACKNGDLNFYSANR